MCFALVGFNGPTQDSACQGGVSSQWLLKRTAPQNPRKLGGWALVPAPGPTFDGLSFPTCEWGSSLRPCLTGLHLHVVAV